MALRRGVGVDVPVVCGQRDLPQYPVEPQFFAVEEGDVALGVAKRVPAPAARGGQQVRVADDVDPGARS
jgi:hypothetical protein